MSNLFNQINEILNYAVDFVEQFGMIGAMLMALLEAIFPSLPLVAIAAANVKNYGFLGYLLTYAGSVLGTLIVFLFIRKLLSKRFQESKFLKKYERVKQMMNWIESRGFTYVMMMMCLPFIPTSFLTYACALSNMKKREFIYMVLIARAVSVAFLSYVGSSILDIFNNPFNASIAIIVLIAMYFISKYIEKKYG